MIVSDRLEDGGYLTSYSLGIMKTLLLQLEFLTVKMSIL